MNNIIHRLKSYCRRYITISRVFPLAMLYGFIYQGIIHPMAQLSEDRKASFDGQIQFWFEPLTDTIAAEKVTNFQWDEVCIRTTSTTPSEYYLQFNLNGRYVNGVFGEKPNIELLQNNAPQLASDCISKNDAVLQKTTSGFYLTSTDKR